MRKLVNPCESLDNVAPNEHRREHGTRIGDLVAPKSPWSLEGLRKVVKPL